MTVRDMFLGANKEEYVPGGTVTVGAYGNQGSQSTIAYNGSFYLVQGHNGYESGIFKSTSGVDDWTYVASSVSGIYGDLYYYNNQFILFSDSGNTSATSTDGVTWTTISPNLYTYISSNALNGMIWDGTQYLAFANSLSGSPGLWSSPDLITWTQLSTDNVHSLASNGTVWVRTSYNVGCAYSTNLSTWTTVATGAGFYNVTYTNGYFVICKGNGWYYSTNGTSWTLVSAGSDIKTCLYSGNTWVFARNGSVSFVPNITSNSSFTTVSIQDLKVISSNYSLNNYHLNNMCNGPSGTCLLSIGDMDFMRITSSTTYDFHLKNEPPHRTYLEYSGYGLNFNNYGGAKAGWGKNTNSGALGYKIILSNDYIAVGSGIEVGEGGVIYSGSTLKASGTTNHLKKLAYSASLVVVIAVGDGGVVIRSTDQGANWSLAATLGGNLRSVCWVPSLSLFIAVGTGGAIWTSPTGTTWTSRTSGTANNLNAITSFTDVEDGLVKIVIVGDNNSFIRSTNGTTWSYFTMSLSVNGESVTANYNGIAYGLGVLVITGSYIVGNVRYVSCLRSPFTTLVPGEQNVWTNTNANIYCYYGIRFDAAAQAFVLPGIFNGYTTLSY
jgi:hypothetical protein